MLLTELSVFKMSNPFFGKAFLRILNSDIQLDLLIRGLVSQIDPKKELIFWTTIKFTINIQ
jgi:hypothetical protein